MNTILVEVYDILEYDGIHIIDFIKNNIKLSMISLELNEKIKKGTKVKIGMKASHIAISKNNNLEASYSNQLPVIIENIKEGKLLSVVKLKFIDCIIESIITTRSLHRLNLKKNDNVTALIKASEVLISEVVDG